MGAMGTFAHGILVLPLCEMLAEEVLEVRGKAHVVQEWRIKRLTQVSGLGRGIKALATSHQITQKCVILLRHLKLWLLKESFLVVSCFYLRTTQLLKLHSSRKISV